MLSSIKLIILSMFLLLPVLTAKAEVHFPIPKPGIPRPPAVASLSVDIEIKKAKVKGSKIEVETEISLKANLVGRTVKTSVSQSTTIDEDGEIAERGFSTEGFSCVQQTKAVWREGLVMARVSCRAFGMSRSTPWVKYHFM